MKLSEKAQATRDRILDAANDLFYLQGYNATGLDKVIKSAGVTKGNFYYYFKSKEELAIATLDWQLNKVMTDIRENVLIKQASPLQTLLGILDLIIDRQKEQQKNGQACGCYFGNFALELSTTSQGVKDKVKEIFNQYLENFKTLLEQAREKGEISENIDPDSASNIILSQLEGAILLNKAKQDSTILDNSIQFIRSYLGKL